MSAKTVHKRSGFTLIELLVVISIIGLLVSILVPSLSQAKWQAKVGKCQAGLHVIGVAVQSYMTSYGMDAPWPFNNGKRDGPAEGSFGRAFRTTNHEGNTPANPAEALMSDLMADKAPIPEAWEKIPTFLDTAEPLFCPADGNATAEDNFNVWGGTQPSRGDDIWGTYPYMYPHVMSEDDPFYSTSPSKESRLAHNTSFEDRGQIGRLAKNLLMYDEYPVYEHYNSLQLNGVVEVIAQTYDEVYIYLWGK